MTYENNLSQDDLLDKLRKIEAMPALEFMRNKEEFFETIQELCDRDIFFKIADWSMFNIDYPYSSYKDFIAFIKTKEGIK